MFDFLFICILGFLESVTWMLSAFNGLKFLNPFNYLHTSFFFRFFFFFHLFIFICGGVVAWNMRGTGLVDTSNFFFLLFYF